MSPHFGLAQFCFFVCLKAALVFLLKRVEKFCFLVCFKAALVFLA